MKPTLGLVSTAGVVPACRSLDCVSVFALTVEDGMRALAAMAGPDEADPFSRAPPAGFAPDVATAPPAIRLRGRRPSRNFSAMRSTSGSSAKQSAAWKRWAAAGATSTFAPFAAAAEILYSDAGVAERVAAVGDFLRDHPGSVLPVTRAIIERGRNASAADVYRARERLAVLRARAMASLEGTALLLVPTAPTLYRIAEVERDPIALNSQSRHLHQFRQSDGHGGDRRAERLHRSRPAVRRDLDRTAPSPSQCSQASPQPSRAPQACAPGAF